MSKSWETFSKNYAKLLEEGDEYDLVINVGQEPLVKSFKAHKVILRTHSSYFYKALSKNWAKKDDGMIVFSKPNISPPVFDVILKYIYTGNADIESQDGDFILSLMTAADELLLKEFVDELQDYLVNYRMEWIQENFYRVLEFAFSNPTYYGQLQDHCLGVVCADPPLLFDNERYFCGVDSVILQSLLKRDDLSMVEVELWNHLIKWAKKQLHKIRSTTAIPDDPTKWCSETMQTFQRILKDNIPFIRFTLMKPTEFREQVWPFKDCLPSQLYDAILWHYLMPESQPSLFPPRLKTIDSKLITLKHAALIATWIDRKEGKAYSHTEIPYEFNLMMRGSRDGYSQHVLHQRCAGQAKTIMLMKIKATEEIFGMFVGGIWSASISARQNDSFMFSFGEGRDTKEPVLSSRGKAAGYELALLRGQERGMDELEMFQISGKTLLSGF